MNYTSYWRYFYTHSCGTSGFEIDQVFAEKIEVEVDMQIRLFKSLRDLLIYFFLYFFELYCIFWNETSKKKA